jgi:hypothetical protein
LQAAGQIGAVAEAQCQAHLERLGHHVVSRCKASPGTYAILENKLGWAPGSIGTILTGGEPTELVPTLHRATSTTRTQGYALRPTNPNALSQVSTEELLLELRRRIIAPRDRRRNTWDDWDGGLDPQGDWPEQG